MPALAMKRSREPRAPIVCWTMASQSEGWETSALMETDGQTGRRAPAPHLGDAVEDFVCGGFALFVGDGNGSAGLG